MYPHLEMLNVFLGAHIVMPGGWMFSLSVHVKYDSSSTSAIIFGRTLVIIYNAKGSIRKCRRKVHKKHYVMICMPLFLAPGRQRQKDLHG